MINGFTNLLSCLDSYFDILNINSAEGSQIEIYKSVILENGAIVHATNKFHGRPWFSNIAIAMNDEELFDYSSDCGICYAQVILYHHNNLTNKLLRLIKFFII